MTHPDLDTKPSRMPFDRYPVVAYCLQEGTKREERFFVIEVDLPRDDLGPMTPPVAVSEAEARTRLASLGLSDAEIEERLAWAKRWMATRILKPGGKPVMWLPPL
jgi:hypothetical protein